MSLSEALVFLFELTQVDIVQVKATSGQSSFEGIAASAKSYAIGIRSWDCRLFI